MTAPSVQISRHSVPSAIPGTSVTDYTKAMLNILEDSAEEKERLEGTQRATMNILEDFTSEKSRLEEMQRAMLNLLEDFNGEREKAEAANRELQKNVESLNLAKDATETINRELEAFAYSVSHDLRTPLRGIDGFSHVLLEDYADKLDENGKDYLQRVRAGALKMGQLIDALLNLSRLTRGEVKRVLVDLSALAKNAAEELKKSETGRRVEFVIADNVTVKGDLVMLRAVMDNLLANAWKFTSKRDAVRIEFGITKTAGQPAYFVRDNGSGFDMNYANKLFTAFQRLHTATEFPGLGIGLATVQRIIRRHGGRVWAEGEVEKGATFYFTLS
jgi:light-regulated signal transduction histidine kinase (bacteriophytochrome)